MTVEQALAFLGFAVVVAGTPGPSNALLTATGARVGILRGLPALAGVAVGMALLMFTVGFGLGTLVVQSHVLAVVKLAGVAVLLWLAWQIARAPAGGPGHVGRPVGFVGAAAFQWVNPKSWLACASGAAAYLDASRGAAVQALTLAGLFVLAAVPCCFVWLAGGGVVQRALTTERARQVFNTSMAGLMAVSAILLMLD